MKYLNPMLKASLFSLFLLTGCTHHSSDYNYLMTHPAVLDQEYAACQADNTASSCDTVKKAAGDFADLVNQRRQDPEGFGKQILAAEMQLEKQHPVDPAQKEKLKIFFAVVAATGSE